MTSEPVRDPASRAALRRAMLMVSVLDDVEVGLDPADDEEGALLGTPGGRLTIAWAEVARVVGEDGSDSTATRERLSRWLRLRAALAGVSDVARLARPVALPVGHVLHPGPRWVQHRVLGGAMDVGVGLLGLSEDPDEVVVLPPGLAEAAGHQESTWWPIAAAYLDEKGRIAAQRLLRDTDGPLRPIGDCDVVTLLASAAFREALCGGDRLTLRSAAVPMRRRGWLDLRRVDPAFAVSAAAATDPVERGFDRPLLVTCEEVTVVRAGGRPAHLDLRDPVHPTRALA